MARSLRSKRRRKLMAIKRKRYGKKEMIRLKKMLGLPTGEDVAPTTEVKIELDSSEVATTTVVASDAVQQIEQPDQDQDWEEIEEEDIVEVIKMKRTQKIRKSYRPNARDSRPRCVKRKEEEKIKEKEKETTIAVAEGEGEQMDHNQRRHFSRHTQRDQFGNYPVWMNQKTVKQLAKKSKKIKRLDKKRQYKHRCKTNTHKYSKQTRETNMAGVDEAIIGFKKIGV